MLVYSTDPNYKAPNDDEQQQEEIKNEEQRLTISLDRRNRGGKQVTLVTGFVGPDSALQQLGKTLRTRCGTGGSVKDGEIIIQGDMRDKVLSYLESQRYRVKKR